LSAREREKNKMRKRRNEEGKREMDVQGHEEEVVTFQQGVVRDAGSDILE